LPEAEIVIYLLNPESPDAGGDWDCAAGQIYANKCGLETFAAYRDDIIAIHEEFFRLREGAPTIILTFDTPIQPWAFDTWKKSNGHEACFACWENSYEVIHEVATKSGNLDAPVFDTFIEPDHDQIPDEVNKRNDRIYPSGDGAKLIAQLLRELGYEPTQS